MPPLLHTNVYTNTWTSCSYQTVVDVYLYDPWRRQGMEAMPHNHHHQLSNSNYVQPGAPPPVVYGGGGGGDECPKCHGKGGIGAFGPCSKGGIHFKKNCALCGGSCLVLRPACAFFRFLVFCAALVELSMVDDCQATDQSIAGFSSACTLG